MPFSRGPPSKISLLLVFAILIVMTSSYTLEGQWELEPNHIIYTNNTPNVTFKFVNKIAYPSLAVSQSYLDGPTIQNTHTGSKQLTVYACKTLYYNYYVNESSIYFESTGTSSTVRECLPNEI